MAGPLAGGGPGAVVPGGQAGSTAASAVPCQTDQAALSWVLSKLLARTKPDCDASREE